ncbi:7-carboxy-7-deazaguanine synthase [Longispora fulva]|uniref:7-carboxy-7-deazaguanine synthase n=1 Tax=Longispora fulva TaxID=619741 RepID=A0A8J7GNL5_9ACTN|nr:7-carboxy-7-deazaguanine synthase QueE [Longispora fulva]MBG6140452.1 organic radical activating enzyme [Longispora fulva]GIG57166.1 7-carboxy-7-deazaguanine synthase [Longispora fulva]
MIRLELPAADHPIGDGGLLVAEGFTPTLQGEGPSAGQVAGFLRLSRCNLDCANCDTPYTWDWTRFDAREQSRRIGVDVLLDWLTRHAPGLVVITGGEPLIQQDNLTPLVRGLVEAGRRVEIETNGTLVPDPELAGLVSFNVSPKLSRFGVSAARKRIVPRALRALTRHGGRFKFVISELDELAEVDALVAEHGLREVWLMPEGTTVAAIDRGLVRLGEVAAERGYHLSDRLHVRLWGDERGR